MYASGAQSVKEEVLDGVFDKKVLPYDPNFDFDKTKCANALKVKDKKYKFGNVMLNHISKMEEQYVDSRGWMMFFKNTNPNNCPIDKCILKSKDCKIAHSGTGKYGHLDIRSYSPWKVIARGFSTEWVVESCFECSNKWQTI